MPVPVSVVLPIVDGNQADVDALVRAVPSLAAAWPAEIDAELVVPVGPLSPAAREALTVLAGDVRVVELADTATFGELCAAAAGVAALPVVLVLPPAATLDPEALRDAVGDGSGGGTTASLAGGGLLLPTAALRDDPVLTAAASLAALTALATRHVGGAAGRRTPSRPLLLSAALIVKNEQRSLAQCLAALAPVVDEVVVCDTGSSDRTVEIAEAMGARVVHEPWTDDFSAARNAAQAATRGRWVLTVDADELLVVDDPGGLRRTLRESGGNGFALNVRSLQDTGQRAGLEHLSVRIVRRGRATWRGIVHETLALRDGGVLHVALLPGVVVEHDGYTPEVYQSKDKEARNRRLAEHEYQRTCTEDGGRWRWRGAYELARVLAKRPETHERAEQLLAEMLRLAPVSEASFRADALLRLADLQLSAGRLAEAERSARRAGRLQPDDARTAHRLATALEGRGRVAEALAVVEDHAARPPAPREQELRDLVCERLLLPCLHGRLLLASGRPADAVAVLSPLTGEPGFADEPALREALQQARPHDWAGELARLTPDAPGRHDAAALDALARDSSADALAAAAALLEDSDVRGALALWDRLPATPMVQVARARCLVALDRVDDAVAALDGLDVVALPSADLLVVAAIAAHVGDAETAALLLDAVTAAEPDCGPLSEPAAALVAQLGLTAAVTPPGAPADNRSGRVAAAR